MSGTEFSENQSARIAPCLRADQKVRSTKTHKRLNVLMTNIRENITGREEYQLCEKNDRYSNSFSGGAYFRVSCTFFIVCCGG